MLGVLVGTHASRNGWHCLWEFVTYVEESLFGINWDGMQISRENSGRFLESCVHLRRALLYLWPQMRRHPDLAETYPRGGGRVPFENLHSEKSHKHSKSGGSWTLPNAHLSTSGSGPLI